MKYFFNLKHWAVFEFVFALVEPKLVEVCDTYTSSHNFEKDLFGWDIELIWAIIRVKSWLWIYKNVTFLVRNWLQSYIFLWKWVSNPYHLQIRHKKIMFLLVKNVSITFFKLQIKLSEWCCYSSGDIVLYNNLAINIIMLSSTFNNFF